MSYDQTLFSVNSSILLFILNSRLPLSVNSINSLLDNVSLEMSQNFDGLNDANHNHYNSTMIDQNINDAPLSSRTYVKVS